MAHTVSEVSKMLAHTQFEELAEKIAEFEGDPRQGVKQAVERARRRYQHEADERDRVRAMYELAERLGGRGVVIGVDEVGRGPLAGPLTVAAVALPAEPMVWGLADSKQLSPHKREEIAARVANVALGIGMAHISPEEIDAHGITAALKHAVRGAVEDTMLEPDIILIDGRPLHVFENELCIVDGDAYVAPIAAASVVAKVTRDAMMVAYEQTYPGYGFASSKGYGSRDHIHAIETLGFTPIHRRSFCRNITPGLYRF